jgi:hypothetical protein
MRRLLIALAALIGALGTAQAAWATFPGRDGELAVVPVGPQGLEFVDSTTGHATTVCPTVDGAPGECPVTSRPSWSPDGDLLAVGVRSPGIQGGLGFNAIDLLDPAGDCVGCNLDQDRAPVPLTAFTAGPGSTATDGFLSIGQHGALQGLPAAGVGAAAAEQPLGVRGAASADWSASGRVVIARDAHVWAGRPGHLRRLEAGVAPSWSPSGREIAYQSKGWVVVRDAHGHTHRLVHGYGPAWSPDGRSIAFFGAQRRLEVVRAGGGAPRTVGDVRGYELAWQPRHATACPAITGATTAASAGPVVVSAFTDGTTAYLACDTDTGAAAIAAAGVSPAPIRPPAALIAINGSSVAVGYTAGSLIDISSLDLARPSSWGPRPFDTGNYILWGLVVDPTGDWAAIVTNFDGSELLSDDAQGLHLPDLGASTALTDLALSGETFTWLHDGQPRSAILQVSG